MLLLSIEHILRLQHLPVFVHLAYDPRPYDYVRSDTTHQASQLTAQVRTNMEHVRNHVEQSATEARLTAQQAADVVQRAAGKMEGGRSIQPA